MKKTILRDLKINIENFSGHLLQNGIDIAGRIVTEKTLREFLEKHKKIFLKDYLKTGEPESENIGGTIGQRLRYIRIRRGLSQKQVAGKTGLCYVTISNLEQDRIVRYWHHIPKIAKALNVPEDLFTKNLL